MNKNKIIPIADITGFTTKLCLSLQDLNTVIETRFNQVKFDNPPC